MNYDNNWVINQFKQNEEIEYVFFWGHTPKNFNKIDKSCLSQWFERPFEYKGKQYLTAEHWMMAGKAKLFKDVKMFEEILKCISPKDVKALGRKVQNFDYKEWTKHKTKIVKNGNYLKFKQQPDLWDYLNSTGNKILVEASPYDKVWGIGMKKGDKGIDNPNNWKGENLLGYALMEVRDKLREE